MTLEIDSSRSKGYRTMAEAAVDHLREAIVSGKLEPGAPLLLEELADSLGMSMSPVREAVRRLESLGLAVHVPHRGARVAELSVDDVRDTYKVRLLLEVGAIERASERFADADCQAGEAALDRYVKEMRKGETADTRVAHTEFHFSLYRASGSPWLIRLIRPAWENAERYRAVSVPGRGGVAARRDEHAAILEACAAHDADLAGELLTAHLVRTANAVLKRMGADELLA